MIYLLCEIGARDLESRILIGAHLLAAGRPVLIGHWAAVAHNALKLPKGVYLFATANRIQKEMMAYCRNAGHAIAFTDEEALPLAAADLISANIDPETLKTANAFFCNDENQQSIVNQVFGHEGTVTGSARMELWSRTSTIYAEEARALRAKGKYILVNSTLASVNSVWKDEALKAALKTGADPKKIKADFEREIVDRENIVSFVRWAVRELKSFKVVVRPHPAEDANAWDEISGIEVVKRSTSLPWILGAELMVHTNSTTGLEAAVLGRPCVNIAKAEGKYAMEKVNLTVATAEEAAKLALRILGGKHRFQRTARNNASGARQIAKELERLSSNSGMPTAWESVVLGAAQIAKFGLDLSTLGQKVSRICSSVGLKAVNIQAIDGNAFILTPA